MQEINWFGALPKQSRPEILKARATIPDEQRKTLSKFGKEYFDDKTVYSYGGYYYDGRFKSVARKMVEHYGLNENSKILDIGCAKGFLLYEFFKFGIRGVYGLDISEYAIEHVPDAIKENCYVGTASDLSRWPDNFFDFVISKDALHNLPTGEAEKSITEIIRISKGPAFLQINSYRTPKEKKHLTDWLVAIKTVWSVEEWLTLYSTNDYQGDYYFLTFNEDI